MTLAMRMLVSSVILAPYIGSLFLPVLAVPNESVTGWRLVYETFANPAGEYDVFGWFAFFMTNVPLLVGVIFLCIGDLRSTLILACVSFAFALLVLMFFLSVTSDDSSMEMRFGFFLWLSSPALLTTAAAYSVNRTDS